MESNKFNYNNKFPPLGHAEHHFNKYPNHPWLKTKEEIRSWIDENIVGIYNGTAVETKIDDDLTVSIISEYNCIRLKKIDFLPVQFRTANKLGIQELGLKSLIGVPYRFRHLDVRNNKILNFEGCENISKAVSIDVSRNKICSFKGFDFTVSSIVMSNNPINSWSGFNGLIEDGLTLGMDENHKEMTLEFIMNTPKEVKLISVSAEFEKARLVTTRLSLYDTAIINMEWLRGEQEKRMVVNNNFKNIESLIDSDKISQKRKI